MGKAKEILKKAGVFSLSLILALGNCDLTALADGPTNITTWAELQDALSAGGNVTLTQDITATGGATYLTIPSGVTVTLDLAGHTIDRGLTGSMNTGHVIKVDGGNLILEDNSTGHTGKITGGKYNNIPMSGNGGGVQVLRGGTFTMNGGKITGCSAESGGGVYVNHSTFTMTGGTISGNSSTGKGGGVYVSNGGTFNMSGGTISGNSSSGNGGGVCVDNGDTFTMTGGTISGNSSTGNGGGVYFEIVTNNNTNYFGVSGTPVIRGNTVDNSANNVYFVNTFPSGHSPDRSKVKAITVTGALTDGAEIYVNTVSENDSCIANKGSGYSAITAYDAAKFHSDTDADKIGGTDTNKDKVMFRTALPELNTTNGSLGGRAYNGEPFSPTITFTGGEGYSHDCSYKKVVGNTETSLDGPPTDAGNYKVIVTGIGNYAGVREATFAISPATVTVTANNASKTYGAADPASFTATVAGVVSGDTISYTVSRSGGENVGTYSIIPTGAATQGTGNYSVSYVNGTFTIEKAASPAVVNGTASVTRGQNTVDLSTCVNLNEATGAVSYAISGDANGCTLDRSILTSGPDTGSVTVNVTVAEDNYYEALSSPITVNITDKATQALSFESGTITKTFGDADFTNAISGAQTTVTWSVTAGTDVASVNETTGEVHLLKDGTATITATAAETATYAEASASYTLTVNRVASTATENNSNAGESSGTENNSNAGESSGTENNSNAGESSGTENNSNAGESSGTENNSNTAGTSGNNGGGSSSGGGSGGSSSGSGSSSGGGSSNTTTEKSSTTNSDGSTTSITSVTNKTTGQVTDTVTKTDPDGSKKVIKTVTNKDGSNTVTDTKTAKDGSSVVVTATKTAEGKTTITATSTNSNGKESATTTYEVSRGSNVTITGVSSGGSSGGSGGGGGAGGGGGSIVIPASVEVAGIKYKVTKIDAEAFAGDKTIKQVTISKNVKEIGTGAFDGAKKLKTITIEGKVKAIGQDAFKDINKKATIKIKANAKEYKKIVKLIKASGIAKTVKFKRIK